MLNEYNKIDDEIYNINDKIKIIFHTQLCWNKQYPDGHKQTFSNYNEYKTNNNDIGSVVIKRKLNYFITIECIIGDNRTNLFLQHDRMNELIDDLNIVRTYWLNKSANGNIFSYLNGKLTVISQRDFIIMKFPADKVLKIEPCVIHKEIGDDIGVRMYIDSNESVIVNTDKINGLYHLLSTIDMANYANTSFTMSILLNQVYNRTDFSGTNYVTPKEESYNQQNKEDNVPTTSVNGRTFNGSGRKKSFLDP